MHPPPPAMFTDLVKQHLWPTTVHGKTCGFAKQYSDMAMIMLVNAKSSRTRRHIEDA